MVLDSEKRHEYHANIIVMQVEVVCVLGNQSPGDEENSPQPHDGKRKPEEIDCIPNIEDVA